jgi:hypothetical protein
VFRNQVKQEGAEIDSACFILSQTTDPEIVLLLEARGDAWHYALARLNQHEFVISYEGQEVLRFPFVPFAGRSDPTSAYTKFYNQLYQDFP